MHILYKMHLSIDNIKASTIFFFLYKSGMTPIFMFVHVIRDSVGKFSFQNEKNIILYNKAIFICLSGSFGPFLKVAVECSILKHTYVKVSSCLFLYG